MKPAYDRPLSVAVTIALHRTPDAGGHVKCWERLAEAAADRDNLDLTVYVLGDAEGTAPLSEHVRFVSLPPAFGTERASWLSTSAGDTDLSPRHPALARRLQAHHVLHATDVFAFGRTTEAVARRKARPLVFSLHTHVDHFARVYTRRIVDQATGGGTLARLLVDGLGVDDIAAAGLARRQARIIERSDRVLVSSDEDAELAREADPAARVLRLRRGIDTRRFHPRPGERDRIRRRHGIPLDRVAFLFAGRVDDTKRVMTVVEATRRLVDEGLPVHLVLAGEGDRVDDARARLGEHVTLLGRIPQETLGEVYAAGDLFVFPSLTETAGNVVIEAMASGLPAAVALGTACEERVGPGGVAVEGEPEVWAAALRPLVQDEALRRKLGEAAVRRVAREWPRWDDVLEEDLLPSWRQVADELP